MCSLPLCSSKGLPKRSKVWCQLDRATEQGAHLYSARDGMGRHLDRTELYSLVLIYRAPGEWSNLNRNLRCSVESSQLKSYQLSLRQIWMLVTALAPPRPVPSQAPYTTRRKWPVPFARPWRSKLVRAVSPELWMLSSWVRNGRIDQFASKFSELWLTLSAICEWPGTGCS
jgi:hypothetical protein